MSNSRFKNFCLWLISRFQLNEEKRFYSLLKRGYYDDMPDEECIKRQFYYAFGYPLNLDNPQTFNEKLQWLKLYNRKPEYTMMADKIAVKDYVAKIIGKEYVIPIFGVWEHFDDIDFDKLPNQFVLKCNHDSHSVVIVKDKNNFNKLAAKKKLEKALKRNFYFKHREWVYKDIAPKIFAEKYMEDNSTGEAGLVDYKLLCFDGKVRDILVVHDRHIGKLKYLHFDTKWNVNRCNQFTVNLPSDYKEKRPVFIDEMIKVAETLANGIPHVRIDLYWCDGRVYFGEYTFYQEAGLVIGFTKEADRLLGSYITVI